MDEAAKVRPRWALIDEAVQRGGSAEGFARSVAERFPAGSGDARLARAAAESFKRGVRMMGQVEREDGEDG